MKLLMVDDLDDVKSIPVYFSSKRKRWAYLSDPLTDMPILICNDTIKNANETFMDVVDEVFKPDTVKRIEASFNLDNGQLFTNDTYGQIALIYGVIAIRMDPDASIPIRAHECVHVSQFIMIEKLGITDFANKKTQELQADIVERYLSIILQLKEKLK